MILKYNVEIDISVIVNRLHSILNQIYKLLPVREQNQNWQKPLQTIIEQLSGFNNLLDMQDLFLPVLTKLAGLFDLTKEEQFLLYRRTIFECLGLLDRVINECQKLQQKD